MPDPFYPQVTEGMSARRKELAPDIHDAFDAFSRAVFAEGALPKKTKQLIAVAVDTPPGADIAQAADGLSWPPSWPQTASASAPRCARCAW